MLRESVISPCDRIVSARAFQYFLVNKKCVLVLVRILLCSFRIDKKYMYSYCDVNEPRRLSTAITLVCTLNYRSPPRRSAYICSLRRSRRFHVVRGDAPRLQFQTAKCNFLWHTRYPSVISRKVIIRLGAWHFYWRYSATATISIKIERIKSRRSVKRNACCMVGSNLQLFPGTASIYIWHNSPSVTFTDSTQRCPRNTYEVAPRYIQIASLKPTTRTSYYAFQPTDRRNFTQIALVFIVTRAQRGYNTEYIVQL